MIRPMLVPIRDAWLASAAAIAAFAAVAAIGTAAVWSGDATLAVVSASLTVGFAAAVIAGQRLAGLALCAALICIEAAMVMATRSVGLSGSVPLLVAGAIAAVELAELSYELRTPTVRQRATTVVSTARVLALAATGAAVSALVLLAGDRAAEGGIELTVIAAIAIVAILATLHWSAARASPTAVEDPETALGAEADVH